MPINPYPTDDDRHSYYHGNPYGDDTRREAMWTHVWVKGYGWREACTSVELQKNGRKDK